jgi:hypothetical protein
MGMYLKSGAGTLPEVAALYGYHGRGQHLCWRSQIASIFAGVPKFYLLANWGKAKRRGFAWAAGKKYGIQPTPRLAPRRSPEGLNPVVLLYHSFWPYVQRTVYDLLTLLTVLPTQLV